eukprot:1415873-Ditylum_brightwellii.AAC.2
MKDAEEAVGDIVLFTNKNNDGNVDEKSHRYCRNAAKEKDVTCHERCSAVKDAFKEYNNLLASVKNMGYEERQYLEKQPLIDIICIIRLNPNISWDGIA